MATHFPRRVIVTGLQPVSVPKWVGIRVQSISEFNGGVLSAEIGGYGDQLPSRDMPRVPGKPPAMIQPIGSWLARDVGRPRIKRQGPGALIPVAIDPGVGAVEARRSLAGIIL